MARIVKAIFDSTSPTVQYGNVHTIVEVEGDDWDKMRDLGLSKIAEVDAMVSPTPFKLKKLIKQTSSERLVSRLTGVELNFDPVKHEYTGLDGKAYLSGSHFPKQFYSPFDSQQVTEAVLKAYPDSDVTSAELNDIWDNNGIVSRKFGTAVHAAMENYIKHSRVGAEIAGVDKNGKKPNKALSKNPFFKKIVEDFVDKFGIDGMISEEFVADGNGHCGRVDAIRIIDKDKKIIRIVDFKTDADLLEKKYQKKDSPLKKTHTDNTMRGYHFLQLSYYAYILEQYGYTVEGLDLYWLNPEKMEWEVHSSEVVDIKEVF